jgi:cytochrome P450
MLNQLAPGERTRFDPLYRHFSTGLTRTDPPDHTRVRTLVSKVFTPRSIETLRGRVGEISNELIDRFVARGKAELIREFAYPLPASVIFEVVGFPLEERDQVKRWSDTIIRMHGTGAPDPAVLLESQDALLAARQWLGQLIERRRREPRDDLLTRLIQAEESGDRLSNDELFTNSILFLVGGHETTTNLLANGVLTLLTHPDQLELLRADQNLMPTAVEELLRIEPPLQRVWRIATEDVEVEGTIIQRGQPMNLILAAANRDPAEFMNPEAVDITREDNRHLSFGMGIHFCLGAALARLEARVAIGALLRRLPDLALADGARPLWVENRRFRALSSLPVVFSGN